MDSDEYQAKALESANTSTNEYYASEEDLADAWDLLTIATTIGAKADRLKRKMFGANARPFFRHADDPDPIHCDDMAQMHSALGLLSELPEFIAAMHASEICDRDLAKEAGDLLWYINRGISARCIKLSDVMQANIDKLKKRYPNGFNPSTTYTRRDSVPTGDNSGSD